MAVYDFKEIEKKWGPKYVGFDGYKGVDFEKNKEKFYMLTEFPYPSGSGLHVGHAFSMTGADVYARFKRMKGYNVMFPMGWDAFGLPAENYAIKTGIKPQETTKKVTEKFREQMDGLGFSFDWDREVNTTFSNYYKWTQWIFIKLFEKGLAEKQEMPINWCPKDKIGLANEEVIDGKCERCGTETEKRTISQWVVKITDYADRLINGLYDTEFIEKVRAAQVNWIGKKEGAKIRFKIVSRPEILLGYAVSSFDKGDEIEVFTTRPDTLEGVTFMVLAPEHPLVAEISASSTPRNDEVVRYLETVKKKSEIERTDETKAKTGVFSGLYAINPITGKEIPIWIADYVLMGFGTGAIMAVPAHDERDFEFAKKFNLDIIPVIVPVKDFVDENAKDYYEKRQKKNKEFLKLFSKLARENGKTFAINGGWAATIQVGYEYRLCEDVDISILKSEKSWWNDQFEKNGFEVGAIFGQENPEEYFQAVRKPKGEVDTHFDIDVIDEVVEYETKVFEGEKYLVRKVDDVIKEKVAGLAKRKGNIWREEADFVMLGYKPYIRTDNSKLINSDIWNNLSPDEAAGKILDFLEKDNLAKRHVNYHLRDWIFSRQHYWGEPIPMIYCEKDGWVTVPEEQLPVVLPEVEKYQPTDTGESPLANITEWVETKCPRCGGAAKRETDTMPNWAGSDWYFLRYLDPNNEKKIADMEKMKYWLPVDVYVGGDEHNTLHLLYSRFIYQFLWDLGVVPKEYPEPYKKRLSHGVVLGPDGNRMSKSKGNVINPDAVVETYGADVLRTYMMFMGPFDATMAWNERSLVGVKRFIEKFYKFVAESVGKYTITDLESSRLINQLIKDAEEDLAVFKFNTVIARLMETTNNLTKNSEVTNADLGIIVKVLAPFAPFVAEDLWSLLGGEFSVHSQKFPEFDERYLYASGVTLSVQVNGKLRGTVEVDVDANEEMVKTEVNKSEKIKKYLDEGKVQKVIYIKGRTINFVVE